MLHEERTDVSGTTPEELQRSYERDLGAIVQENGVDAVADRTGIDPEALTALVEGESPELDLEAAAAVQAIATDLDAEEVYAQACDHLLLGMSMAVLDVEALASDLDRELSPKEIQQKLERRAPMSLGEFAEIEHLVASRRN